jgi:hypothetical protein
LGEEKKGKKKKGERERDAAWTFVPEQEAEQALLAVLGRIFEVVRCN